MDYLSFIVVYVNDMNEFGAINQEYVKHFGINPPSRYVIDYAQQS